jgi:hypothetical protein
MNAIEERLYPQGPQPDVDPAKGRFRRLAAGGAVLFLTFAAVSFVLQVLFKDRATADMVGHAALDATCGILLATAALTFVWPDRARRYGLPAVRNSDEREDEIISVSFGVAFATGLAAAAMYALLFHPDAIVLAIAMQAAFYVSVIYGNRRT